MAYLWGSALRAPALTEGPLPCLVDLVVSVFGIAAQFYSLEWD